MPPKVKSSHLPVPCERTPGNRSGHRSVSFVWRVSVRLRLHARQSLGQNPFLYLPLLPACRPNELCRIHRQAVSVRLHDTVHKSLPYLRQTDCHLSIRTKPCPNHRQVRTLSDRYKRQEFRHWRMVQKSR